MSPVISFGAQGSSGSELIATRILRGARRMMSTLGYSSVCELVLPNGRRADIVAISGAGRIAIIEIKSSVADFRSDHKWPEYADYCDQLFFAVAPDGPADLIPAEAGLIVADGFAGEIVRNAPLLRIAAAKRRAMLLAFAIHAAERLHRLQDPQTVERSR
ncbi:MAG: MmcB family DNA repair protein [Beijerinckiaceae bacterium]